MRRELVHVYINKLLTIAKMNEDLKNKCNNRRKLKKRRQMIFKALNINAEKHPRY